MAVHAYFMAVFVVASVGGATDMEPWSRDQTPLIAADSILAGIDRLHVVLATTETPQVERLIDVAKLKARVAQVLGNAGVAPVEREADATEGLIVHIEGVSVPDDDMYVFRVQTALRCLVTVAGSENHRFQAEVWRVRPVMKAVAGPQAGEAISDAVLVQAEVFTAAREAARRLSDSTKDVGTEVPTPGSLGQIRPVSQSPQAAPAYPFVASKSSNVFHRADCRWARNIADNNRVGYGTREEAVQSGKRPCKTCKP